VRKQKQTGSVVDKKMTRDRGEWPWNHMITSKQVETGPARNMQRFEGRASVENWCGYPKDTGVTTAWQTLRTPFAITPLGQLHQSPPSPIPGDLGRGPTHQSHVLEHSDTYGQAQAYSKGRVDRPCQPSFCLIKFWHVRNPLPQSTRLCLSVLVC